MVGRESLRSSGSEMRDLGSSLLTRSCISRAALLVKVTPRMFPGAMPRSTMCAMRKVITRVLPVPAPARIKTGPFNVSAARRCCGLSELRFNIGKVYGAEKNSEQEQTRVVKNFFPNGNLTNGFFSTRGAAKPKIRAMDKQTLTLGHSPDPDDAFMFYALA